VFTHAIDETFRHGNNKSDKKKAQEAAFSWVVDNSYFQPMCDSHLKILISKKTQFVGIKTLNNSLRFV